MASPVFTEKVLLEGLSVLKTGFISFSAYMGAVRIANGIEGGLKGLMSEKGSGADHIDSGFRKLAEAVRGKQS